MEHLEIEIKFNVSDFYDIRSRLVDMGAICIGQRTFESNIRYDTEDGRLLEKGCLLRLRKDTDITLTFKSPPSDPGTEYKVYRELEVTVNDFDAMDVLLKNLGFTFCQIYEKWRETWRLDGEIICMDTMPFAGFWRSRAHRDRSSGWQKNWVFHGNVAFYPATWACLRFYKRWKGWIFLMSPLKISNPSASPSTSTAADSKQMARTLREQMAESRSIQSYQPYVNGHALRS